MIKSLNIASFYLFLLIIGRFSVNGQITGGEIPEFDPDSIIVFRSPRPLLTIDELKEIRNNGFGLDIAFNEHGFGLGAFYKKFVNEEVVLFGEVMISGAKNTDELELFDPFMGDFIVPYKINRLFSIPLMVGAKYHVFRGEIDESFSPYVSGAMGLSLILSTPYVQNRTLIRPDGSLSPRVGFFQSFGDLETYTAPAGYVSIGASFGSDPFRIFDFSIRYYYVPFDQGLESIVGFPMTQFGGISLNMRIGTKF